MSFGYLKEKIGVLAESGDLPFTCETVELSDIFSAEADLGTVFDANLKRFWTEIGYGFLKVEHPLLGQGERVDQVLGFMHPSEIVLLMKEHGERFPNVIPFFDTADATWMVMRTDGMVAFDYDPTVVVASTFDEFVRKVFDHATFFVQMADDEHRIPMPEAPSIA